MTWILALLVSALAWFSGTYSDGLGWALLLGAAVVECELAAIRRHRRGK